MGGQACVFYGAAEFSRDCDIVVLTDSENLKLLEDVLKELDAVCIAVPPMEWHYLDKGHAIHFRCRHPEASGIRLDVMARLRGCREFEALWANRTSIQIDEGTTFDLLGIADLVPAKKTQREKDWPMIQRLVEAHYNEFSDTATEEQVEFWLLECRTPDVLIQLATSQPFASQRLVARRPLLKFTLANELERLKQDLELEKKAEMQADALYWQPLIKELEALRLNRRNK